MSVKEECEKWWENNNHGMNNLSNIMMLGVTLFKDLLRFVHYILNECNLLSIIAWLMYNMFDIKHKSFLVYEPFPNWRLQYISFQVIATGGKSNIIWLLNDWLHMIPFIE